MRVRVGRQLRHRLYVAAVALLAAAGIVLLNMSAGLLESKFDWSADFSRSGVFTLSEDTRRLLSGLTEDVELYAVYENDTRDVTVEQLLRAYDRASERVTSRAVDPVDDVDVLLPFTRDGAAVSSGSIIVSNAARDSFQILDYYDFYLVGANGITGVQGEQSVSSAIRHLNDAVQRRAIFMNAHTETTIASVPAFATHLSASGYGLFQSTDPFSAEFASMLNPESDMLVFLSPNSDLESGEADAIIDYVRRGGSVMTFMDCARSVDNSFGIALQYGTFENFDRVFAEAGMELNLELVLMPEAKATLGSITRFSASAAEGGLDGADGVVMSESATIALSGDARPLLLCPADAYSKRIEPGMSDLARAAGDEAGVRCVSAVGSIGEGRVALTATSSAVTGYFGEAGNRGFVMKLAAALLNDGDNIVIPPVSTGSGTLKIRTFPQQVLLIVLTAGVLPLAVLTAGGLTLYRRRRRSGRMEHD